jgi:DNA-binding NarL/FixJ family response regulator
LPGEKEVVMEKRVKILVVDDEPEFIADLQVILKRKDYQLIMASERARVVEKVQDERPDLIILGTIAPRGDAFLVHQWLRKSPGFSSLPIIVVDAPPEKHLLKGWRREEGMQLEAEAYFCRPINPAVLLPQVEKLLDKVTRRIRVLVVDDHTVVREGIHALLSLQRDMQVVGEAIDGREAVEKAGQLLPDVVLMDIVMPGMNGLEATQQICRQCKRVNVLMLSQYDEEENVIASDQAGALGFVPKKSASSELLLAGIRAVSQGKHFKHPVAA